MSNLSAALTFKLLEPPAVQPLPVLPGHAPRPYLYSYDPVFGTVIGRRQAPTLIAKTTGVEVWKNKYQS